MNYNPQCKKQNGKTSKRKHLNIFINFRIVDFFEKKKKDLETKSTKKG